MADSRPAGSRNVSLLFYFVCIFGLSISYSHLWHKSGVVALARLGLEPEPLSQFYTSLYLDYKARVSSVLSHYDVVPPNLSLTELSFLRSWLGDNIFTDFLETVPLHVYIVGVFTSVIITARAMDYPVLSPPSNNFFPEFSSTKSSSFFLNSSVEPHNHVFNLVMMLWERISESFFNIVTYGPIIFSILFHVVLQSIVSNPCADHAPILLVSENAAAHILVAPADLLDFLDSLHGYTVTLWQDIIDCAVSRFINPTGWLAEKSTELQEFAEQYKRFRPYINDPCGYTKILDALSGLPDHVNAKPSTK